MHHRSPEEGAATPAAAAAVPASAGAPAAAVSIHAATESAEHVAVEVRRLLSPPQSPEASDAAIALAARERDYGSVEAAAHSRYGYRCPPAAQESLLPTPVKVRRQGLAHSLPLLLPTRL